MENSPRIKGAGHENDQIQQLLAQLQTPADLMPDSRHKPTQMDLEKAHQQMQESIKQMKLVNDPSTGLMNNDFATEGGSNLQGGFNGQNSLYELAQRVGQPLSSSNFNSMSNLDNENDFQQFLKGEGSLGSANTNHYNAYQQYGVQSNVYPGQPDRQGAYGAQSKQPYVLDPPQQLMMQMQESNSS